MEEDTFGSTSIADNDYTIVRDGAEEQPNLRRSNRDSGISSGNNRGSEQINRFLADVAKSQNVSQSMSSLGSKNNYRRIDISQIGTGTEMKKHAQALKDLAYNWKKPKSKLHQRQPTSAPISDLQQARGEMPPPPTRFSDRLTPEVEVLRENEKPMERRPRYGSDNLYDRPRRSHYDEAAIPRSRHQARPRRASETRRKFELNIPPLSKPPTRSRSVSRESCCNSSRCCHQTIIYQYNYPDGPHNRKFKSYSDHYHGGRRNHIGLENEDDVILERLRNLKRDVLFSTKVSKTIRNL